MSFKKLLGHKRQHLLGGKRIALLDGRQDSCHLLKKAKKTDYAPATKE